MSAQTEKEASEKGYLSTFWEENPYPKGSPEAEIWRKEWMQSLLEHAEECLIEYDGAECDGACLAEELQTEANQSPPPSP